MVGAKQARFPEVYSKLTTEELLQAYAAGPERIRRVLAGLMDADLIARPRPGKWSIQEIAAHVTDSELIGAGRIRLTYAQPGGNLAFYNQDVWCQALGYQNFDSAGLDVILQLFEALRATTARIFRAANEEDWRKTGVHREFGHVTLRHLLELYADHSERHLEQILQIRELLGKPLQFPLLLKTRLY